MHQPLDAASRVDGCHQILTADNRRVDDVPLWVLGDHAHRGCGVDHITAPCHGRIHRVGIEQVHADDLERAPVIDGKQLQMLGPP